MCTAGAVCLRQCHSAQTLFDVQQIPCDNQVRKLLDPITPGYLDPVFVEVFEGLEQHRMLTHFRVLGLKSGHIL